MILLYFFLFYAGNPRSGFLSFQPFWLFFSLCGSKRCIVIPARPSCVSCILYHHQAQCPYSESRVGLVRFLWTTFFLVGFRLFRIVCVVFLSSFCSYPHGRQIIFLGLQGLHTLTSVLIIIVTFLLSLGDFSAYHLYITHSHP